MYSKLYDLFIHPPSSVNHNKGNKEGCGLTGCVGGNREDFTTVTKGASRAWPWGPHEHSGPCERKRWQLPPLAFFDSTRLTRRAAQKPQRGKINMSKGFCLPQGLPLPRHPHSWWFERQCAVSLRQRAQISLARNYPHKSPSHPDKQLRLYAMCTLPWKSTQAPEAFRCFCLFTTTNGFHSVKKPSEALNISWNILKSSMSKLKENTIIAKLPRHSWYAR